MSFSLEIPYFEKILVGPCLGGKNFPEKSLRPIQGQQVKGVLTGLIMMARAGLALRTVSFS